MFRACCHHYPGRTPGCVSRSLRRRHRPSRYSGGSAPTLALSRPAQCSLALRPARSADLQKRPFLRVLQTIRRLLIRPECFRLEREFAGPVFHRGEQCTLARRTEQSGREFSSGGTTTRAQAAALQIGQICPTFPEHARRGPQHFQPSTPPDFPIDPADLQSRGSGAMVRHCRSRMRPDQPIPPFDPTPVTVTKPFKGILRFTAYRKGGIFSLSRRARSATSLSPTNVPSNRVRCLRTLITFCEVTLRA